MNIYKYSLLQGALLKQVLMMSLLCVCFDTIQASDVRVKITNNADVAVAFVIVRTELGLKLNKLYVSSEGNKLSSDAWNSALASMQSEIGAVILAGKSGGADSITVTNGSQKTSEYDRVLWMVPLPDNRTQMQNNIHKLVLSVQTGTRQSPVQAFEIGSAKTVIITGNEKSLKVSTPGRYKESAKAFLKSGPATAPSTLADGGIPVANLTLQVVQEKLKRVEGAKTYAKPPKPIKTARPTAASKDNPADWPTKLGNGVTAPSFNDAVKVLNLPAKEVGNLKSYKNFSGDVRQDIKGRIRNLGPQVGQLKSKKYAYQAITEYMLNIDDPREVRDE